MRSDNPRDLVSANVSIAGQLLRAGTSVGANTEEARSAYSRRELAFKNSTVLKEVREARFWLRLIAAKHLAPAVRFAQPLAEAEEHMPFNSRFLTFAF